MEHRGKIYNTMDMAFSDAVDSTVEELEDLKEQLEYQLDPETQKEIEARIKEIENILSWVVWPDYKH